VQNTKKDACRYHDFIGVEDIGNKQFIKPKKKGGVMNKITCGEVHRLFDYDPATGIIINRTTRAYNALKGEVAGYLNNTDGYIYIKVNEKAYKAHRLAWFYVYGYFPENGLDHINRIKTDNRIVNLREATKSCNAKNCKININNTSGITGVSWHKRDKKWQVRIHDQNHKLLHIGYFDLLLEAAKARYTAEIKYGYISCNTETSALKFINKSVGCY